MKIELVLSIIAISVAIISLFTTIYYRRSQTVSGKRMRVLEFASEQFDKEQCRNARKYIQNPNGKSENFIQRDIHEYIRALDRIGNGLRYEALELDFFFKVWKPDWVIYQWFGLSNEVDRIEKSIGIRGYFEGLEWLVNQALISVDTSYSSLPLKTRDENGQMISIEDFRMTTEEY